MPRKKVPISDEEQRALVREWQTSHSLASADKLVRCTEGLVWFFVFRFDGCGVDRDDLAQCGRLAVWRAMDGFDDSRDTTFSAYARQAIFWSLAMAARGVPREEVLDGPIWWWNDGDEQNRAPEPSVEANQEDDTGREMLRAIRGIVESVAGRDARKQAIAQLRLLSDNPCTLERIGRMFGMTKQNVSQIELSIGEALARWLRPLVDEIERS
jgi:RNA polymerase sigma factor (sigma-70 family)